MRSIGFVLLGLLALIGAVLVAFFVGMRMKFRPLQDGVRRMNRAVLNPETMKTAGEPGAPAAVIRHVGRTSGKSYETPVGAAAAEDGFVIPLPYGTSPDWLKNVLAAGSAVLVHEGHTYSVDEPRLVTGAEWNRYFAQVTQLTHRLFGVDDFLTLRRFEEQPAA